MNRGSLVRILLTMALVGDGVGLATALSEVRKLAVALTARLWHHSTLRELINGEEVTISDDCRTIKF